MISQLFLSAAMAVSGNSGDAGRLAATHQSKSTGARVAVPRPEHPRPDFERKDWINLNGVWEFGFDTPPGEALPLRITVPFPWESKLSGIQDLKKHGFARYRRQFTLPEKWKGKRVWLNFGAVDYKAEVSVNAKPVGNHEGGYSEFRFEVTDAVRYGGPNIVEVKVEDHTDPATPTGKQVGWYTPTSGIWQTVWLEATGAVAITILRAEADDHGAVTFTWTNTPIPASDRLIFEFHSMDSAFGTMGSNEGYNDHGLQTQIQDPIPWTPEHPHLYPFVLIVKSPGGEELDRVKSYFGCRSISIGPHQGSGQSYVLLNSKPIYVRGALDQSFNPDGIYTAPSDEFLKRDMELAKAAGFNMLRIHIKADEPRRLYWADKLGILLQCDIPCFYDVTDKGRPEFEDGMHDQIDRDINHPSIYAWTVFNEEWGIWTVERSGKAHRVDWVEKMFDAARSFDPSRLIQDNTGWSHLKTDMNSYHWYSRDVDGYRKWLEGIDKDQIGEGKTWNYIEGRKQRGEPWINNEYGYVSAGNGDGDWSWGVLAANNAMRAQEKLVGYTYTELTDIEWEHNGFYNYDRSPKEFGFDFWAPGMQGRDLFSEDYLVLDVPAIKREKPGALVTVPALVSNYSGALGLKLYWRLDFLDSLGQKRRGPTQMEALGDCPRYRVTPVKQIELTMPDRNCIATLIAWLEDAGGNRVHINYTQWLVRDGETSPRVERLDPRTVALRFRPEDFASSKFSELSMPESPIKSKQYGRGAGTLEYHLKLPAGLPKEQVESIELRCEVAAKAGRQKVDWPSRVNPEDYPQTDGRKFPTSIDVSLNGAATRWELPDDPANARGVLSHWAGVERGSFGYLKTISAEGAPASDQITIRMTSNEGGLAIYGEDMGCYPMDPTIILHLKNDVPDIRSDEPITVDRYLDRLKPVLPTARESGTTWRYTTEAPPSDWTLGGFDDSGWKEGLSGFGTEGTPGATVRTVWDGPQIWLRKTVTISKSELMLLRVHHDEDCEIYVNGKLLWKEGGYTTDYRTIHLTPAQIALFYDGTNTIGVHCRQTAGGQYIDVGLLGLYP